MFLSGIKRLQRFDFITREDSDFPRLIAALQGGEALQNPILVKEQTPSETLLTRHFRTSRRGGRWAVASAVLIALAAVGLYFYKANEERARLLAEANANVDRVSRKESIRCNPLRVQNVDDWGTVVVIFPDNFDFADVYRKVNANLVARQGTLFTWSLMAHTRSARSKSRFRISR